MDRAASGASVIRRLRKCTVSSRFGRECSNASDYPKHIGRQTFERRKGRRHTLGVAKFKKLLQKTGDGNVRGALVRLSPLTNPGN